MQLTFLISAALLVSTVSSRASSAAPWFPPSVVASLGDRLCGLLSHALGLRQNACAHAQVSQGVQNSCTYTHRVTDFNGKVFVCVHVQQHTHTVTHTHRVTDLNVDYCLFFGMYTSNHHYTIIIMGRLAPKRLAARFSLLLAQPSLVSQGAHSCSQSGGALLWSVRWIIPVVSQVGHSSGQSGGSFL